MKKFLALTSLIATGIAAYLLYHRNDWRDSYTVEVTDHISDELDHAKREFFESYPREETRRNIFDAFSYLDYDYMGNLASLSWDIGWVARVELGRALSEDQEGKEAYLELQKYLLQLEGTIDDLTPRRTFIDRINGGIWGEFKRGTDIYDRPEPNEYTRYDTFFTPIIMNMRKYPEYEIPDRLLKSIKVLKKLSEHNL